MALGLAGCSSPTTAGSAGEGDLSSGFVDNCVVDSSFGAASAIALSGAPASGQICPRGDEDWYALDVPAGQTLLDLRVGYPSSVTHVAILAQLFAADGRTPVDGGELVDSRTGAHQGTIATTLEVPMPGHYFIVVRDSTSSQSDSLNTYVLSAVLAADPDTHEPNDSPKAAKAPDGAPGFIAYRGDEDWFRVTVPEGSALLDMKLTNPAAAKMVLHVKQLDAAGNTVSEADAPPSTKPLDTLRLVPAPGDYFFGISAAPDPTNSQGPQGVMPDRRPEAGYAIELTPKPELDPNDKPVRNDHGATATCLAGTAMNGTCSVAGAFSGSPVAYHQGGSVGSLGDRDFFRFDVAAGTPALIEITARIGPTPMQLAVDLLVPHAGSPCTLDNQCTAINVPCKSDFDCELSHSCLPAAAYHFCANGQTCRLCAGASACVPIDLAGAKLVCAAPQYLIHDGDGMTLEQPGMNQLRSAQPLFSPGPYYVVVHDFGDNNFDYGNSYQLDVALAPEPDPGDQNPTAALRNNFYNPYPMQGDDLAPSRARARDINDDITASRFVSGYISYQSDEDWFSFRHPCPGFDCGLVFEWTQPGPSPMHVALLMRRDDLSIHESWTYLGMIPTQALGGPLTATFGEGDCHECSFASAKYPGNRLYYLQVRDVGSRHWDYSGGGAYRFRLKTVNVGCPLSCAEQMGSCGCFCASLNMCPASPAL